MTEAQTIDRTRAMQSPEALHRAAAAPMQRPAGLGLPVELGEADRPALATHLLHLSALDRDLRFQGKLNDVAIRTYVHGINLHRDIVCGAYRGARLVAACHVGVYLEAGVAVGEVGVSVDADCRGTGLAHRMIEAAVAIAAERGVRRLDFVFLRANGAMLQLARRLGAEVSFDDGEWTARLPVPHAADLPPMTERRAAAAGIEVLATDGDPARTALLVHGAGGDPWQFRSTFVPHLRRMGLRVMALSLRHHGRSAGTGSGRLAQHVGDVLEVIRELGEPQMLIGHSMGALVAQHVLRHVAVPQVALLAPVPPDGLSDAELARALGALKTDQARWALAEALTDCAPPTGAIRASDIRVIGGVHDKVLGPDTVRRTAAHYGTRPVMLEAGHALLTGPMWRAAARAATEPLLNC